MAQQQAGRLAPAASDRDQILEAMLLAASEFLISPQVFTVAGEELRGQLALEGARLDDQEVRNRRLPLRSLSVLCRCVRDRIPYLGPVPETDPCTMVCEAAVLGRRGVVSAPVVLGSRTACLLVGHPRKLDRELRESVMELVQEAALELGKLIAHAREAAAGPAPAPIPDPEAEVVHLLERPVRRPPERSTASGTIVVEERRRYPRFPLQIEVTHASEHNFFTGFMEDLSEGGLFIATFHLYQLGHRFELEFTVPGHERPILVACEVRWVRCYQADAECFPGMGVQFLDLEPSARAAIQAFIALRQPIFYD